MLKPILDRVIVKMIEQEDKTDAGILIANVSKEKSYLAEVIEVGDCEEMYIKKGDKVIVNKYSGVIVNYNKEEYVFFKQSEILAIVK